MLSLYISERKVDLPENFSILFNHTLEDRTNPTVVKNSFSKTLELPGTDGNNKIFGTFFRNDRYQIYGTTDWGASFDPSKRVPFAIYENAYGGIDAMPIKGIATATDKITAYTTKNGVRWRSRRVLLQPDLS